MPYTWYLYPQDDHTNEVLSRSLPGEDFVENKKCSDGKKRHLWRCDYQFVNRLKGCSALKYRVFVQEGDGQVRPRRFPRKKKYKLIPAKDLPQRDVD